MPNANQPRPEEDAADNPLGAYLEAYQPPGSGKSRKAAAEQPWDGSRSYTGPGNLRSAKQWRADWEKQHRPPIENKRSFKTLWLSLGVILAFVLSIAAIVLIDQTFNTADSQFERQRGSWSPTIHWGGH